MLFYIVIHVLNKVIIIIKKFYNKYVKRSTAKWFDVSNTIKKKSFTCPFNSVVLNPKYSAFCYETEII